MSARPVRAGFLPFVVAASCVATLAFAAASPPVRVASVERLPAAVQKTVRAESAGGTIRALWKETGEDGKIVYEAELLVKGLTRDLNIAADGTVLVREQQLTLAELPEPVRRTVLAAAGGRKIRMLESVSLKGDLAYYEAHVGSGKSLEEVKVGLDGARIP